MIALVVLLVVVVVVGIVARLSSRADAAQARADASSARISARLDELGVGPAPSEGGEGWHHQGHAGAETGVPGEES